jgi:hypothetical protein
MRKDLHQPDVLKCAKCLPDSAARRLELLGQLYFPKRAARRQLATDDGLADVADDCFCECLGASDLANGDRWGRTLVESRTCLHGGGRASVCTDAAADGSCPGTIVGRSTTIRDASSATAGCASPGGRGFPVGCPRGDHVTASQLRFPGLLPRPSVHRAWRSLDILGHVARSASIDGHVITTATSDHDGVADPVTRRIGASVLSHPLGGVDRLRPPG